MIVGHHHALPPLNLAPTPEFVRLPTVNLTCDLSDDEGTVHKLAAQLVPTSGISFSYSVTPSSGDLSYRFDKQHVETSSRSGDFHIVIWRGRQEGILSVENTIRMNKVGPLAKADVHFVIGSPPKLAGAASGTCTMVEVKEPAR